ncbi:MAG: type II toxin-antitoxin system RelE/ParE family toxin [Thermoguttaceae bacterium]
MVGKRRKLTWHPNARDELMSVLAYFKERNGSNAYGRKFLNGLETRLKYACCFPQMYEETNRPETHVIDFENYRIVYSIKPDTIEVLSVWDARREPRTQQY